MPTYVNYRFESYAANAAVTSIDGTTDVDDVTEEFDLTAHGFDDGEQVLYEDGADATTITGLSDNTMYWAHRIDANTISLHTSRANALSDTSRVGLTDTASSTTNSLTPQKHAVLIDTAGTYNLNNCFFDQSGTNDIETTHASGVVTLNVTNGGTVPTVTITGAGTVVITNDVTTLVNVKDNVSANLQNARVLLEASDGTGDFPFEDSVTITRVTTTATVAHTAHGLEDGDLVVIRGADQPEYNGPHTITNSSVNAYDYTVSGSPTTPATGTIISSGAILSGLTDAGGNVSAARTFDLAQPVKGVVRKSTASPRFKDSPIIGTISASAGLTINAKLILDE